MKCLLLLLDLLVDLMQRLLLLVNLILYMLDSQLLLGSMVGYHLLGDDVHRWRRLLLLVLVNQYSLWMLLLNRSRL